MAAGSFVFRTLQSPLDMASVSSRIDGPVAVIGDVHGQTGKLKQIIGKLAQLPDIQKRWIVFIGDLVDRGPDSAGAVRIFFEIKAQHDRVTWLCGNHELTMMGALGLLPAPSYIDFAGRWIQSYSSEPTFASYGVPYGDLEALKKAIPEEHKRVMADLPWCIEHPDFLFVHAGMDRNLPFDTQLRILRQRDYTLSNPPWLYSKDFIVAGAPMDAPVPLVVGHVPVPQVRFDNGMINVDTGAGADGELSCLLLPEGEVLQSESFRPSSGFPMQTPPPRRPAPPWWKLW